MFYVVYFGFVSGLLVFYYLKNCLVEVSFVVYVFFFCFLNLCVYNGIGGILRSLCVFGVKENVNVLNCSGAFRCELDGELVSGRMKGLKV